MIVRISLLLCLASVSGIPVFAVRSAAQGTTKSAAQSTARSAAADAALDATRDAARDAALGAPAIPLFPAPFLDPAHALDESRYTVPEQCQAAFDRTLDSLSFIQRGHLFRDTTNSDPWAPMPAGAIQVATQCLRRFRVAELPSFTLTSTLRIAIAANADSLVQVIVARKLAAIPASAVHTRAMTLDTVVTMLMQNMWNDGSIRKLNWTQAHVQLAREYIAQIKTFGPAEVRTWRDASYTVDARIAAEAKDVDASLIFFRNLFDTIRQVPPASIPDADRAEMQEWLARMPLELKELTYLKTTSHADLASVIDELKTLVKRKLLFDYDTLIGRPAPPMTANYWFNTQTPGVVPSFPASNTLTTIFFIRSDCHDEPQRCLGKNAGERLRYLHQTFPNLQILLVTQTSGWFRTMDFANHPEQEAALLYHYYADSLNLPGAVGVVKTAFRKDPGPDGHVVPLPMAPFEAYRGEYNVVIDPSGMIVYNQHLDNEFEESFLHNWFAQHPDARALSR